LITATAIEQCWIFKSVSSRVSGFAALTLVSMRPMDYVFIVVVTSLKYSKERTLEFFLNCDATLASFYVLDFILLNAAFTIC
jgi:hypothetical protein